MLVNVLCYESSDHMESKIFIFLNLCFTKFKTLHCCILEQLITHLKPNFEFKENGI